MKKEVELQEMLRESIQQAKEGKVREISFQELNEMFENAQCLGAFSRLCPTSSTSSLSGNTCL